MDEFAAPRWVDRVFNPHIRAISPEMWHAPSSWPAGERVLVPVSGLLGDHRVLQARREKMAELVKACPHLSWFFLSRDPSSLAKMGEGMFSTGAWAGCLSSNQQEVDSRLPGLVSGNYQKRFLVVDPLLSQVSLSAWADKLDWVVVGGDYGPRPRPFMPVWAEGVISQCWGRVPVFVSQLGSNCSVGRLIDCDGGDPEEWEPHLRVRESPYAVGAAT